MKITGKILKRRARQQLDKATYLDLSGLGTGAIEGLQNCANLQILDLSDNNIEEIEGINFCAHLWNVNFSHNKLSSLTELSHFYAFGTVDLSLNNLSWKDLTRIQDVIILDLHLHGNPILEKDAYYRIHVIDCLPNIWMLDGRIVTSAERLQVQQFFHDSALSSHPVRRKLSDQRPYTSRQRMNAGSIHGIRVTSLVSKFARNEIHSADTDLRRLSFLFENMQEDLSAMLPALNDRISTPPMPDCCLLKIIDQRQTDRERCNVLLLLLLSSLEFQLPLDLFLEALQITKLDYFAGVDATHLFSLERRWRIRLVTLLLSASKLDRDMHVEGSGGLYDRLYLCLYYLVSDLVKSDGKSSTRNSSASEKSKNNKVYLSSYRRPQTAPSPSIKETIYSKQLVQSKEEHRMLLASEIVLLLNVIPSFYKRIEDDPTLQDLLQTATNNVALTNKIITIAREARRHGGDLQRLCNEISEHSLQQIERAMISIRYGAFQQCLFLPPHDKYMPMNETRSEWKIILNTKNAYPRRPKSAILTSGEHLTSGRRRTYADMQSGSILKQHSFFNVASEPKLALGSNILLGPQNMARVIAIPEPNIALVQMNTIPAPNGSVLIQSKNEDDHYCYVDVTRLELNVQLGCWKPRGTTGDKVTLQPITGKRLNTNLTMNQDAFMFDEDHNTQGDEYRSWQSSRLSIKTGATLRTTSGRMEDSSHMARKDEQLRHLPGVDRDVMSQQRPLSALFKEKMNLRLPIQFSSDLWTEMDSQNDDDDELITGSTKMILDSGENLENIALMENIEGELLEQEMIPGIREQDEIMGDQISNSGQSTERSMQLAPEMTTTVMPDTGTEAIFPTEYQENPDEKKLGDDVESTQIDSNELEPELQALDTQNNKAAPIKRNRTSDLRRRAISARQPKHAKVVERNTKEEIDLRPFQREEEAEDARPASAVTRPRDLRSRSRYLYLDDVEMERPESASSFQLERTEAWKSSTSSLMNNQKTPSRNYQKTARPPSFGFMSVPESNRQSSFQVVALRPTPPQRPPSPSQSTPHRKTDVDSKPKVAKSLIIMNSKKDQAIKLASNWLAEGKDLHDEYKKSRVYMSPHIPGYLDGIANQPSQKKNVSYSLPLTSSLTSKLERLSSIRSSKRATTTDLIIRDFLPPGIGVPESNCISRFSHVSDVRRLVGKYPTVTLIKPQKK